MEYEQSKKWTSEPAGLLRQSCVVAFAACCALLSAPLAAQGAAPEVAGEGMKLAAKAPAPDAKKGKGASKEAPPAAPQAPVCTGDMPPPTQVSVTKGKSVMLRLPEPVVRRTLGDPEIVGTTLVSPQGLYVVGTAVGSTNMILQGKSGKCTVVDVFVSLDTEALQAKLHELMPGERGIKVASAADSLVLTGIVSDAMKVDQAMLLANAYVARRAGAGGAVPVAPGAGGQASQLRVVNMLSVAAPQQVMLEVKVAEVSKTLANKLGSEFKMDRTNGSWTYSILSSFLTGGGAVLGAVKSLTKSITLDAEFQDGLIKILAEPNIIAISGQEAAFLAGGKIFIPVAQASAAGGTTITLQEEEFGVGLKFTPTVLEGGRINLRVAPEVSELSPTGTTVSATGTSFSVLPTITTRRASTTVQLHDGQSFAIAGLINSNATQTLKRFPGLGDIPILGALFRSQDFQNEKTELLFVVTPRLVKPLPPDYALPTDSYIEPNSTDAFAVGKLEGAPAPTGKPAAAAPAGEEPAKAATGFEVK